MWRYQMTKTLYIDDRVGSKHLVKPLRKVHNAPAVLERLEFGDVLFVGNNKTGPVEVGIELKKVPDLLESIMSGRLMGHQVPGMVRYYDVRYLIVEGVYRASNRDGLVEVWRGHWMRGLPTMTYSALDRMLITLEQMAGFHVRRTSNSAETVQAINDLFRWWQKQWSSHKSHLAFDRSHDVPPDRNLLKKPTLCEQVANLLPGIGWRKSHDVAKVFRTVSRMASSSIDDWLVIPGIGRKISWDVYDAIRSKK